MRTDRELLELAAKAAGLSDRLGFGFDSPVPYFTGGPKRPEPIYWNPLTDDGDALRLAVKLRLQMFQMELESDKDGVTQVAPVMVVDSKAGRLYQYLEDDFYEATRRAIVRAAAAIGEQLP